MADVLVVYYSRTGYTRTVAEAIAQRCGADVDRIEETRGRSGVLGYLRSAREALSRQLVEIRPPARNAAEYRLAVIGTPVWAGRLSSPVRSWVTAHAKQAKQLAFFCTQSGSGAEKVFAELAELGGRQPLATLAVDDREIKRNVYSEKLAVFVGELELPRAA